MEKKIAKVKRTYSTKTRKPWQDSVAQILRTIDLHNKLSLKDPDNRNFHMSMAKDLKKYLVDLKDWILEQESVEEWSNSE